MRDHTSFFRLLLGPLLALCLAACSEPTVEGGFMCRKATDCLSGYRCNTSLHACEKDQSPATCQDGVCPDRIKLALSAPLKTDLGRSVQQGIEAYFKYINERGFDGTGDTKGIMGRTIEFTALDDGGVAETAKKNVESLVAKAGGVRDCFAFIGNVGTETANTVLPVTNAYKTFYFGGITGSDVLRNNPPDRFVYNLRPSLSEEAKAQVRYLTDKRYVPMGNIAVFAEGFQAGAYGFENAYGASGLDGVRDALSSLSSNQIRRSDVVYATYDVQPDAKGDYDARVAVKLYFHWVAGTSGQLRKIADYTDVPTSWDVARQRDGKDNMIYSAVIGVANAKALAALVKGLRDNFKAIKAASTYETFCKAPGYFTCEATPPAPPPVAATVLTKDEFEVLKNTAQQPVVFASSSVGTNTLTASLTGTDCTNDVLVTEVVPPPTSGSSIVTDYLDHLKTYNAALAPNATSLESYLVARLFTAGLQAHGTRLLTSDLFVSTLEGLEVDYGLAEPLKFTKNRHQATTKVYGNQLYLDKTTCKSQVIKDWQSL